MNFLVCFPIAAYVLLFAAFCTHGAEWRAAAIHAAVVWGAAVAAVMEILSVLIMPGALILEAMAQTAIILFATADKNKEPDDKKPLYFFGSVKARLLHPVVPGDQMKIKVENVKSLPAGAYVSGEAFVDDKKVSEAELVFSVKNE